MNDHGYIPEPHLASLYSDALHDEDALTPLLKEIETVPDRYELVECIGRGAIKTVFKCYDHKTSRLIALARPHDELDLQFYDILIFEAQITAQLQHPNIIKVHDLDVGQDGLPFFTMDLKSNQTLEHFIQSNPTTSARLQNLIKICDAISYAHSHQVIHLDLKPENIQCDQFGEVLVCDWGIAKKVGSPSELDSQPLESVGHVTLIGDIKGSLGYMSPEHIDSSLEKDERSDIYSLGCLLYFALTGAPPYSGDKATVIKATQLSNPKLLESNLKSHRVPTSLRRIVLKAMAKEKSERYQHVLDLRTDLEHYLTSTPSSLDQADLFYRSQLVIKRNPKAIFIGLIACVILTLTSIVANHIITQKENEVAHQSITIDHLHEDIELINLDKGSLQHFINLLDIDLAPELRRLTGRLIYNLDEDLSPRDSIRIADVLLNELSTKKTPNHTFCVDQIHLLKLNLHDLSFSDKIMNSGGFPIITKREDWFADYRFDESNRPSVDQLCKILDYFLQQPEKRPRLVEAIIRYDLDTRTDRVGYNQVICKLIQYFNHSTPKTVVTYTPSGAINITSDAPLHVTSYFRKESILSHLQGGSSLRLATKGVFDLKNLHHADFDTLDLSASPRLIISTPIHLTSLRTVYLPTSYQRRPAFTDNFSSGAADQISFVFQ